MSEKLKPVDKMIESFNRYIEHFGCDEPEDLEKMEAFTEEFSSLICEHNGSHRMIPDQCNKREHDYCVVCRIRRDELEAL